jgi:hypothetical protein
MILFEKYLTRKYFKGGWLSQFVGTEMWHLVAIFFFLLMMLMRVANAMN